MRAQVSVGVCTVFLACLAVIAAQGANGPTTHVYSTGPKGEPGDKGSAGRSGNNGLPGDQGRQGATGLTGIKGSRGTKGDDGVDGVNRIGAEGGDGRQGATGATGAIGVAGPQARSGDRGVKGVVGLPGAAGENGARGARGDSGGSGAQGVRGPTGKPGANGDAGGKGEKGERGVLGGRGSRGLPGDSLQNVISSVNKCSASLQCTGASSCVDTLTGPMCVCNDGYDFEPGQGTNCIDIDECTHSKCHHGCKNTDGGFRCTCLAGYSLKADGRNCELDGSQCGCNSEERCVSIASGPQCLPNTILMADGGNAAVLAAQSRQSQDVQVEQTPWMNENWVITFMVWGAVLTIAMLLLAIWLIHESKRPTMHLAPVTVEYHMLGTQPLSLSRQKLDPAPIQNNGHLYHNFDNYRNTGNRKHKVYELQYGNYNGDIIYQ